MWHAPAAGLGSFPASAATRLLGSSGDAAGDGCRSRGGARPGPCGRPAGRARLGAALGRWQVRNARRSARAGKRGAGGKRSGLPFSVRAQCGPVPRSSDLLHAQTGPPGVNEGLIARPAKRPAAGAAAGFSRGCGCRGRRSSGCRSGRRRSGGRSCRPARAPCSASGGRASRPARRARRGCRSARA